MHQPDAPEPFARALPQPPAVSLQRVCKAYKIYDKSFSFLREVLTGRPCHREKPVLHDISLEIRRGEVVGIIGRNGAGKSTLLKLIAGTLAPSSGHIDVNGRVSAILELGTGFNPAYSGRDNVIVSALMRGMSEAEVRRKFDAIVAFSGLEDVIDQPFHTYSSGMQARLAFAAAVSVDADVIIIDEALAAGDARFTARSLRRIREICESGVTALFVSHTTYQVMQLCTRAVWIDEGRVRMAGAPIEVVRAYEYELHQQIAQDQGRSVVLVQDQAEFAEALPQEPEPEPVPVSEPSGAELAETVGVPSDASGDATDHPPPQPVEVAGPPTEDPASPGIVARENIHAADPLAAAADELALVETRAKPRRSSTGQYRMTDVAFLDCDGRKTKTFRFGERLIMRVAYECLLPELPEYSCGLAVAFYRVSDFEAVMYFNTNYPHSDDELRGYFDVPFRKYIGRSGIVEAVIDPLQVKAGEYYVAFGILPNQPGMHEFYEYVHCEEKVTILPNGFDEPCVFYPMVTWRNGSLDRYPASRGPQRKTASALGLFRSS